jgi:hypothetical protein
MTARKRMKKVRNKAQCLPSSIPFQEGLTHETISGGAL